MTKRKIALIVFVLLCVVFIWKYVYTLPQPGYDSLKSDFINPPDSAKPSCFWWWFNSLVDKGCITRDLEEFRAKGLGGVTLVCTGNGYGVEPMPRGPAILSAEWRELYRHALKEANRLGLEFAVNFCGGGWNMGGSWIKPEYSARWYVQSQLALDGPQKFSGKLPVPVYRDGYEAPHYGNVSKYMAFPEEKADYRDTAIVAFREPEKGSADLGPGRKEHLAAKSNRKDADCFLPAQIAMEQTLVPWKNLPGDNPIKPDEVIDLTSKVKPDGTLDWDVPEGRWTILRTGHVLIGCDVCAALPEIGFALEVDCLNPDAVDEMFANLGKVLIEDAGKLAGKTLKYFHTDSFEDGFPNWTGKILEKFKEYRGYDPMPYLPVFAGRIVGSAEVSDRFLYDYRKTVADCVADGNYGRFAERAKQYGLGIQCEAAGPSWSGTFCMDGLKNLGRCANPMGEFWTDGIFVVDNQNKVGKQTASAAHIYGKRTASAEAFTSFLHWQETPGKLKPFADRAFCEGINRFVFHTMTCTRPQDGKPGYEYGAGTHFSPNITWWQQAAGAWLGYVNRCQAMLQSGLFVADVLYYNGDWAPNLVGLKHVDPSLGKGYDYDVCNAEALLTRLSAKNGRLVLPDGMSYGLLVLPDTDGMPVEVARKIRELVEGGAVVVGRKPGRDPGLRNYPDCDREVKKIAEEVWGGCDGQNTKERRFGRGRVIWGRGLREVLIAEGIQPDFEHTGGVGTFIDFIHRKSGGTEIYFLANRNGREETVHCSFRVKDRQPELWDPVTGMVRELTQFEQKDGRTSIPLKFEPNGSMFVVFGKPEVFPRAQSVNFADYTVVQEIKGSWAVRFDPEWFYPAKGMAGGKVVFEKLSDWTKRPEIPVRYFSGTAVYETVFDLKAPGKNSAIMLSLGTVNNLTARIRLNGKDLGVLWCSPWQVDVTGALEPAGNRLEIEVVNPWLNRVVGDKALPAGERRTRTNVKIEKDTPLVPSGLLGPVSLLSAQ